MPITGKCPNINNDCAKADSKELITLPDGAEPVCPGCQTQLVIQDSPTGSGLWKIASAGGAAIVLALVVWGLWPSSVAAPVVTSPLSANGMESRSFQYQISATNDPTSYNASGLPQGLTLQQTTGLITGIPSMAGTFPVNISATNNGGVGNALLTIVVQAAPPPLHTPSSPPGPPLEAKQNLQQGMTYVSLAKQNPKKAYENYDNAILEFTRAIEQYPCYAPAYGNRAVAYMQQKKFNNALKDLDKAVECDSQDPIIYYNLTALHSLENRRDLALDALDKALTLGFNNYDALRSDPDLNTIRRDRDFRKVLEKHKIFPK